MSEMRPMQGRRTSRREEPDNEPRPPRGLHAELATAPATPRPAPPSRETRAAQRPIREGRRSASTLRRQAISRRSLAVADMFAAGMALALCVGALSKDDSLHLVTLLALPLVVV